MQEAYPEPDDFVLQLNAAVEGFRNVTFILQNEMKIVPEGATWYRNWQDRMRSDPVMRWLHDSRTTVVHKGDLETYSTATISLRANWLGPLILGSFDVPPLLATEAIAVMFREGLEPDRILKREGVIEVERRWVEAGLKDWEVLAAFAHCFGVLWTLLDEAHGLCGVAIRDFQGAEHILSPRAHLGNQPDCMLAARRERTAVLHLGTGELMTQGERSIRYDPAAREESRARYRLDELQSQFEAVADMATTHSRDDRFLEYSRTLVEVARRMLVEDGCHVTVAFLHRPTGEVESIAVQATDQQDKYLAMERIAECVRLSQADQILYITEAWHAPEDSVAPDQRASEAPDRQEALYLLAATARGRSKSREWFVPFSRDAAGNILLGETHESVPTFPLFLAPVLAAWAEILPTPESAACDGEHEDARNAADA
jgi:hypothetical protein